MHSKPKIKDVPEDWKLINGILVPVPKEKQVIVVGFKPENS